jgi:hypothetical protein
MSPVHHVKIVGGVPDWLTWLSVIATAAAAILAALTIWQAKRQAQKSAAALVRERRIDFKLDGLMRLAELLGGRLSAGDRDPLIATQARMLPAELIPLTRAAVDLPSTEAAKAWARKAKDRVAAGNSLIDLIKEELAAEIVRAVDAVLATT